MGISRDSAHKRRLTGGKRKIHRKKRKFEMGRQPSGTKIGPKRIHLIRVRGGHHKSRAILLETGNYSWGTEAITRKTRIVDVSYNATSNELVRTDTLVKGCIVQIDSTPFKQWYEKFYGSSLGKKKTKKEGEEEKHSTTTTTTTTGKPGSSDKKRKRLSHKLFQRQAFKKVDPQLEEQFNTGRLYARISSRPGQSGRADGYILEGDELGFYIRKMEAKKKTK